MKFTQEQFDEKLETLLDAMNKKIVELRAGK